MTVAELSLDMPAVAAPQWVSVILDGMTDAAARDRVLSLERRLAAMTEHGYQIGKPARVRQPTKYVYAEWHIPIRHAGAQCVLSFFI